VAYVARDISALQPILTDKELETFLKGKGDGAVSNAGSLYTK
jgi:hypothetical protein